MSTQNAPQRHWLAGRRAGFTLLELTTVIFCMAALVGIGLITGLLATPIKLSKSAYLHVERLQNLDDVSRRFRADVSAASGVAAKLGAYEAGGQIIILEFSSRSQRQAADEAQPNAKNTEHVVWHWDGKKLDRILWSKRPRTGIPLTTGRLFETVVFAVRPEEEVTELTVRLTPKLSKKARRKSPPLVISAVLGSDRR